MMAAGYTHSVGVQAGGFVALSYKGFVLNTKNLALQMDLGCRMTEAATVEDGFLFLGMPGISCGVYTFEVNPNITYQDEIKDFSFGALDWVAGGGFSLGLINRLGNTHSPFGKFGLNAFAGMELELKDTPVTVGVDFRPGYGIAFGRDGGSFFDWCIGASVRYRF